MPAYDFDIVNRETGKVIMTVPIIVPVDERDEIVLRRRTVPNSITVAGSAANPTDMATGILKGYHRAEEKSGSRFQSSFTPEQIKRAWAQPD